jgi:hypothetical protein
MPFCIYKLGQMPVLFNEFLDITLGHFDKYTRLPNTKMIVRRSRTEGRKLFLLWYSGGLPSTGWGEN